MADLEVSVRIPRPQPGEVVTVRTNGLIILAELDPETVTEPVPDPGPGAIVDYTPVSVVATNTVRLHAAAVYQRPERTRVDRYTLCASGEYEGYRVTGRRRDVGIEAVNCTNCRRRLRSEGVVD